MEPLDSARRNIVAHTEGNTVTTTGLKEEDSRVSMFYIAMTVVSYILLLLGVYFGSKIAHQFDNVDVKDMTSQQNNWVNGMLTIGFVGVALLLIGVGIEKLNRYYRAAASLLGASMLSMSGTFLWIVVLSPDMVGLQNLPMLNR